MKMKWPRKRLAVVMLVLAIFGMQAVAETDYNALFASGTGQPDDPFQIATAQQLCSIGSDPNLLDKHYVLTSDIYLAGYSFDRAVIAADSPFSGSFDGQKFTIKNMIIHGDKLNKVGLFGEIAAEGRVNEVAVVDANIVSERYQGGIIATFNSGQVSRCNLSGILDKVSGGVVGENKGIIEICHVSVQMYGEGGLVGRNSGIVRDCVVSGTVDGLSGVGGAVGINTRSLSDPNIIGVISNCTSFVEVTGDENTGGLAGGNVGRISNCKAYGSVSGRWCTGGLAGYNGGTIVSSESSGSVNGDTYTGGFCGMNDGSIMYCSSASFVSSIGGCVGGFVGYSSGIIESCFSNSGVIAGRYVGGFAGSAVGFYNCYCKGVVSGKEEVGGFVGSGTDIHNCYSSCVVQTQREEAGGFVSDTYGSPVESCFWDQTINHIRTSEGGTGLSTEEMMDITTYQDADWDIVSDVNQADTSTWLLTEGNYPRLSWELINE
jgi:hypothetical protein